MTLPENGRGRSATDRPLDDRVTTTVTSIVVRCACCRRELRAEESVRRELGPVCRRRVAEAVAA